VFREADPLDSQVVSVAVVNGMETDDGGVVLGGTFRAFSKASFYHLHCRIEISSAPMRGEERRERRKKKNEDGMSVRL
jgi:IAA-amino acid hydrolase